MTWRHAIQVLVLAGCAGLTWGQVAAGECTVGTEDAASLPPPKRTEVKTAPVTSGPALRAPDMAWVNSTLAAMTLDEKIGQMIMPGYTAATADSLVSTYRVGGFIFQGNNNLASSIAAATNHLQGITSVPLLFSVDCEAGLGARVTNATRFPLNMGTAASRRYDLAQAQGGVTARECRAVGIHIGFGPVLDANTEPINPIIGPRAYSDRPSLISQMAAAYVQGANAEGLLCTYKHFPGHGATTGDSHSSLPTVTIPISELQSRHVAPYSTLIAQGTGDLVMTAHVWYTQLDPGSTAWPATLSSNALTGILRNQLAYQGCVISDSFGMDGVQQAATTYDGVRIGVLAGLDIILTPPSVSDAFNGLKNAVTSNQIPISRINDSVRRILILKSRAGMPESTTVSETAVGNVIAHPDNLAVAEEIGKRTICTARVQAQDVPITSTQDILVYNLTPSTTIFYRYEATYFNNALTAALPGGSVTFQTVSTSPGSTTVNNLVANAQNYDRVIVTSHDWKPTIPTGQQNLVNQLKNNANVTLIYCSFGSPYHITMFSGLKNYFCAFSSHYDSQEEMAKVLVGQSAAQGEWPITIAGVEGIPVKFSELGVE